MANVWDDELTDDVRGFGASDLDDEASYPGEGLDASEDLGLDGLDDPGENREEEVTNPIRERDHHLHPGLSLAEHD